MSRQELRSTGGNCQGDDRQESCSSAGNCQADEQTGITQMKYDLNDAFLSLGFEVYAEDDISSEKYAFDNLNFAKNHPARESMDTYWIEGTEDKTGAERLCLRPHLTGGSVRYLMQHGAPARFVYPGGAYRNETTDARHERAAPYCITSCQKAIFSSMVIFLTTV